SHEQRERLYLLTYFCFYTLTDAPTGQPVAPRPSTVEREGQCEAVSLYVRIEPDLAQTTPGPRAPDGTQIPIPDFGDPGATPLPLLFLSYSSTGRAADTIPGANIKLASDPDVRYPQRPSTTDGGGFDVGTAGPVGPVEPWRPSVFITSGTHK